MELMRLPSVATITRELWIVMEVLIMEFLMKRRRRFNGEVQGTGKVYSWRNY